MDSEGNAVKWSRVKWKNGEEGRKTSTFFNKKKKKFGLEKKYGFGINRRRWKEKKIEDNAK